MTKPNYSNSIVSVTNSILRHYGAATHHASLPLLDELLSKKHKNVVLMVLDGLGVNVLERNLPKAAFLRKHVAAEISSVYPSTTTAALSSILSGKTPAEHGWIGWSCYFSEVDKCVDLFSSNDSYAKTSASDQHLAFTHLAYEDIFSQITKANDSVKIHGVSPYHEHKANSMEEICKQVETLCNNSGNNFIYAYHSQPDHILHDTGVSSGAIKAMLADYSQQIESLMNSAADTLLILTADHGMTKVKCKRVDDYPHITSQLKRHICVERRCCSFYVKDEYLYDFPVTFSETFGDKFELYTHDEFLQSGLLGDGNFHQKVHEFIGDYIAVAVSDIALWYRDINGKMSNFKGSHAGLTKEEMTVPLIIAER